MELSCQAADLKTGSWSWATGGPSAIAGAERTAEGDWHRQRPRDRVTGALRGREGPGAEGCGLSDLRSTRVRGQHRNGASATNPRPRSLPTPERARERMVPGTQRGPRPLRGASSPVRRRADDRRDPGRGGAGLPPAEPVGKEVGTGVSCRVGAHLLLRGRNTNAHGKREPRPPLAPQQTAEVPRRRPGRDASQSPGSGDASVCGPARRCEGPGPGRGQRLPSVHLSTPEFLEQCYIPVLYM